MRKMCLVQLNMNSVCETASVMHIYICSSMSFIRIYCRHLFLEIAHETLAATRPVNIYLFLSFLMLCVLKLLFVLVRALFLSLAARWQQN